MGEPPDPILLERQRIVNDHATTLRKHFDAVMVIGYANGGPVEASDLVWSEDGCNILMMGILDRVKDQVKLDARDQCNDTDETGDNPDDED